MAVDILGAYKQVLCALRSALEEDLSILPSVDMAECRIQVACDWIPYAGKPLLWWARENIGYTDVTVDDEANYVEGGPLYDGPPAMCFRRWGFWLDRFEEVGKNEESGISDAIRKAASEAAEVMRTTERAVGNTLSGEVARRRVNA